MTGPNLNVDHDELVQLANGQEELRHVLSGGPGPPQITVVQKFPTSAAADAVLGKAVAAQDRMDARVGSNADNLRASAGTFHGQEGQNAGQLKNAVSLGETGQFLSALFQPAAQVFGSVTQFGAQTIGAAIGTVGGLAQAAEGPLTGVVGAVSSATIQHPNHNVGNPDVGPGSADLNSPVAPAHTTPPPVHIRSQAHGR